MNQQQRLSQNNSTVRPHCSHYGIMITAQTMSWILTRSCENNNVFSLDSCVCIGCVRRVNRVKKDPDETFYCAPAAALYEITSQWIWGFSLEMAKTAQPCITRSELMIMQKINLMITKKLPLTGGPRCQDNKVFFDQNFCSGFSTDLLRSYLQSCSGSVCFHFLSCPAVPKLFSPSATFMP